MNGPGDTSSTLSVLPTPRTSLQNIGEKRDKDEETRNVSSFQAFGADGFTFLDFIDIINPLQHIPVVGTLYREMTGDQIDPGSRIAGGSLFGGPIGAAVSLVDVAVEQSSGQDMGEHMMALFGGEEENAGVTLANVPPANDFVADANNPITANAEVLEWARRETSRAASDDSQARLNPPPAGSVEIAANIEVLNWARQEASHGRPVGETASAQTRDKRKTEQHQDIENQQAALDTTMALGRDQSQLSGATAPLGGWFSETMLLALARYDEGAQLGKAGSTRRVEETVNTSE